MKTLSEQTILREYVKQVLCEDEGYGGMVGASFDMSPYGAHFASGNAIYTTFIKPFVDVKDVAMGKTKELSQKAQTLGKVAFETVGSTLLPFLYSQHEEIFKKEKEEIDKIKAQYGEVYNATWDAFKDNDVALTAFFCFPGAVLTGLMAKKAPDVAINMLSTISGGTIDSFLDKVKKSYHLGSPSGGKSKSSAGGGGGGGSGGMGGNYDMGFGGGSTGGGSVGEALVRELAGDKKKPKLSDIVTNQKVVKKALSSPEAQRMQQEARDIVKGTLQAVFEQAQAVITANSLEDLQKKLGKPLKGLDKLKGMQPQERAAAEKQLLTTLKKSMKEMYSKNLEMQVKQATDAGIPENSGYVKLYVSAIQKIKSL